MNSRNILILRYVVNGIAFLCCSRHRSRLCFDHDDHTPGMELNHSHPLLITNTRVKNVNEELATISLLDQCKSEIARLESLLKVQRHLQANLERKLVIIRHGKHPMPIERV